MARLPANEHWLAGAGPDGWASTCRPVPGWLLYADPETPGCYMAVIWLSNIIKWLFCCNILYIIHYNSFTDQIWHGDLGTEEQHILDIFWHWFGTWFRWPWPDGVGAPEKNVPDPRSHLGITGIRQTVHCSCICSKFRIRQDVGFDINWHDSCYISWTRRLDG